MASDLKIAPLHHSACISKVRTAIRCKAQWKEDV